MSTIVTRAGKGSPLTNNEVDANFVNLNTDKAELSGATFTGEIVANAGIALGDNDKATFGSSDDLQLYHDGSHSWIKDAGAGNIYISSDGYAVNIVKGENTAAVASFIPDGPVNLYNAGDLRLATTSTGIDVTGTATMDGLVVDGSKDSTNVTINAPLNTVGGGSLADYSQVLFDNNLIAGSSGQAYLRHYANSHNDSESALAFGVTTTTGTTHEALRIDGSGDISFYDDTGTTAKMVWDASAEMLTTSGLTVAGPSTLTSGGTTLSIDRTGGSIALVELKQASVTRGYLGADSTKSLIAFNGSAVERFSVSNTGIDVTGTVVSNGLTFENNAEYISVKNSSGAATRAFGVNGANNLYIGGIDADIGPILFVDNGSTLATLGPAGLDVTGTATMDGLTVDGQETINKNYAFGASNYHIKLGEDSADSYIGNVNGSAFIATGNYYGSNQYTLTGGATALSGMYIDGTNGIQLFSESGLTANSTNTRKQRMNISTSGDISFYEDTGTTAKFFWDASAESLGIGTTPASILDLGSDTNTSQEIRISGGRASLGYDTTKGTNGAVVIQGSANKAIHFENTADTPAMVIDSSGNVGIGTSSPPGKLTVSNNGAEGIEFFPANFTNGNTVQHYNRSGTAYLASKTIALDHRFDTSGTERMRIDSSGNLLVGTTSSTPSTGGFSFLTGAVDYAFFSHDTGVASGNYYIGFRYGDTNVGAITQNGTTGVLYNSASDQRLKENIVDANDAGSKIDAIQVRQYDWKADGAHQDYGMIAQELVEVAPEAVSGDADSEEMMGVDYSKLVPMLIKEIQSLRNRVATLEGN